MDPVYICCYIVIKSPHFIFQSLLYDTGQPNILVAPPYLLTVASYSKLRLSNLFKGPMWSSWWHLTWRQDHCSGDYFSLELIAYCMSKWLYWQEN